MNSDTFNAILTFLGGLLAFLGATAPFWPKLAGLRSLTSSEKFKEVTLALISLTLITLATLYSKWLTPRAYGIAFLGMFVLVNWYSFARRRSEIRRVELILEVAMPLALFFMMAIPLLLDEAIKKADLKEDVARPSSPR